MESLPERSDAELETLAESGNCGAGSHSLRQTNAFQLPYSRGGGVLCGFYHADFAQRDGFRQVDAVYGMSPVFLRREGRRDEADS